MRTPNVYLVEVIGAEFKKSKAGNPMFEIQLADVNDHHKFLCRDWIVIEGKAAYYGAMKLKALGIDGDILPDQAARFLKKRAVVMLKAEEWRGKPSWKVDSDAMGFSNGYLPASDWIDDPKEKLAPTELFGEKPSEDWDPADTDATPF